MHIVYFIVNYGERKYIIYYNNKYGEIERERERKIYDIYTY
jgi:hypothetical protein